MNVFYSTFPTPLGTFSVAVDASGAVIATAFGGLPALKSRVREVDEFLVEESLTADARAQILDYLNGRRLDFALPLAAAGSSFQHRVWEALIAIPRGRTSSYGELAKKLKSSARAVGRANATNPICLIVPCHRVIGADGALTGFAFGTEIKRRLLDLEKNYVPPVTV